MDEGEAVEVVLNGTVLSNFARAGRRHASFHCAHPRAVWYNGGTREGESMSTTLLNQIEEQARKLTRAQQLELARRLLARHTPPAEEGEKKYDLTDLIGIGKGTWKTAEEVRQYIEEERNSWER